MEKIIITEQTLEMAKSFAPYAETKLFLAQSAVHCFERVAVSGELGGMERALPPMYKEDSFKKQRYMIGAFLRLYLGIEPELENADADRWLVSLDEYDRWHASHILNQIERMKTKARPELRDKIFDILADWRELEKKMNAEVFGLLQVMNDPVERMIASIQSAATPEVMKNIGEQMKNIQSEIETYTREKAAGNHAGT